MAQLRSSLICAFRLRIGRREVLDGFGGRADRRGKGTKHGVFFSFSVEGQVTEFQRAECTHSNMTLCPHVFRFSANQA